jgi:hypothetical protein
MEPIQDEIISQLKLSSSALTSQQLYAIPSVRALVTPQPDRPELEKREVKRICNKMVKMGLLDDGGAGGTTTGPFKITGTSVPIEAKTPKPEKKEEETTSSTSISPDIPIGETEEEAIAAGADTGSVEDITVTEPKVRKTRGTVIVPSLKADDITDEEIITAVQELESVSDLSYSRIRRNIRYMQRNRTKELIVKILEKKGISTTRLSAINREEAIKALERFKNTANLGIEATTDVIREKIYYAYTNLRGDYNIELERTNTNFLKDFYYKADKYLQKNVALTILSHLEVESPSNDEVEKTRMFVFNWSLPSLPSLKASEITDSDLVNAYLLYSGKQTSYTPEEVYQGLKNIFTKPTEFTKFADILTKDVKGFAPSDESRAAIISTTGKWIVHQDNLRDQAKSVSKIGDKINLSTMSEFMKRKEAGILNKTDLKIVDNLKSINTNLKLLTEYLNGSPDHEILDLRFKLKNEGNLTLQEWNQVERHRKTGTTALIPMKNLDSYQKLKFVINRIDKVEGPDRDNLIKFYHEFSTYAEERVPIEAHVVIDKYYKILNATKVSAPNLKLFDEKLLLLSSLSSMLKVADRKMLSKLQLIRSNTDEIQQRDMIVLDRIMHINQSIIVEKTEEYDFGRSKYSPVTRLVIKTESALETKIRQTSSVINMNTAYKVAEKYKALTQKSDDEIDDLYEKFKKGESTGFDLALLYFYHRDAIDPMLIPLIETQL